MKINSKLFQKSIDLKKSDVFGGMAESTEKVCRHYIYDEYGCNTAIVITNTDDNGQNPVSVTLELECE